MQNLDRLKANSLVTCLAMGCHTFEFSGCVRDFNIQLEKLVKLLT